MFLDGVVNIKIKGGFMFKDWLEDVQEFCYFHFYTVLVALGLTAFGAYIAFLIDPFFTIFVSAWLALPALAFKRAYAKKHLVIR